MSGKQVGTEKDISHKDISQKDISHKDDDKNVERYEDEQDVKVGKIIPA